MEMIFKTLIFLLVFTNALACPRPENLAPCTCEWPDYSDSYVTCAGLDNEQDLTTAAKSLVGKKNIHSFTIKDSVFTFIPSDIFKQVQFIELEIINSSLMALTDTEIAFEGLENYLEFLRMDGCTFMNEWDWSILRNLKKLTTLEIERGDLENIELEKINVGNLKTISFSHNRIEFINDKALSVCKNLMILSLSYNRITEIKRTMFPNPALELIDLDLSHNNIEKLPDDIFSDMPKLMTLSIGYNKILFLGEKVFSTVWSQLDIFEALGNEIRCDCRITWILSKKQPETIRATCAQPQDLKGKNIDSLQSKDLWCIL